MDVKALFALHTNKFIYAAQTDTGIKLFDKRNHELNMNNWGVSDTAYTARYNQLLQAQNLQKQSDLNELLAVFTPTLANLIAATLPYPAIELVKLVERDEYLQKYEIVDSVYQAFIDSL